MFDFAWSEIALIGIVALVLIGPKDLPVAIRAVTDAIKKMRRMASELQGHVDEMVRDADLGEARDTFRDLRSMNLRSQILRAVDDDGSMRRTLTEKPLAGENLMTSVKRAPPAVIARDVPEAPTEAPPSFVPPTTGRPAEGPPAFIPPSAAKT